MLNKNMATKTMLIKIQDKMTQQAEAVTSVMLLSSGPMKIGVITTRDHFPHWRDTDSEEDIAKVIV